MWTNTILVENVIAIVHSTTTFSENVIVVKTSYQGEGFTFFDENKGTCSCGEKQYNDAFQGVYV